MIGNLIKRLWLPLLCIAANVGGWMLAVEHVGDIRRDSVDPARVVLFYALQLCFWLLGAWTAIRLIGVIVWDGLAAKTFNGSTPRLLKDVTVLLVLVIATTGVVAFVFQRSVTGIWATSGAVGILLGIALKDVILDVFTGLAMNLDRPFVIGDWVRIHDGPHEGLIGQVLQISWRTTRLRTEENMLIVIPNSRFGSLVVTNFAGPTRPTRFEFTIHLDAAVPVERARRVLLAGLIEVQTTDGFLAVPPPCVLFQNTSNSGFEYRLQYWIHPWSPLAPNRARDVVFRACVKHVERAGISIAFPKQDLTFKQLSDEPRNGFADRLRLLDLMDLFGDLPLAESEFIASQMRPREFRQGEVIIQQGESGDSMFVLWEGLLSVSVVQKITGEQVRVAQISPGEFFGEMSLLTGETRSATIRTESDGCVFEITKDCMTEVFRRRPEFLDSISRIVAERRLAIDRLHAYAADPDKSKQAESLARQFKDRIRGFFRGMISG